jgi:23S rRNA (uracil1939-C5)-methyltransferase
VGDDGTVVAAPPVGGHPGGAIARRIGAFAYEFDARCFFQGHSGLLAPLVERVVGGWQGPVAYDLYAGVGLFALPLGRRYGRVIAVEGDRTAVRFARRNARLPKLPGVEIVGQAVESWIALGLPDDADRVVVDPPRDGLSLVVRRLLAGRRPRRITYVSCHAAALARDLAELAATHAVESIVLVDLFPQTGQMETVVQLVRRDAGPGAHS